MTGFIEKETLKKHDNKSDDEPSKVYFSHASSCADVVAILHECNGYFCPAQWGILPPPNRNGFLVDIEGFTYVMCICYSYICIEIFLESNGLPLTPLIPLANIWQSSGGSPRSLTPKSAVTFEGQWERSGTDVSHVIQYIPHRTHAI